MDSLIDCCSCLDDGDMAIMEWGWRFFQVSFFTSKILTPSVISKKKQSISNLSIIYSLCLWWDPHICPFFFDEKNNSVRVLRWQIQFISWIVYFDWLCCLKNMIADQIAVTSFPSMYLYCSIQVFMLLLLSDCISWWTLSLTHTKKIRISCALFFPKNKSGAGFDFPLFLVWPTEEILFSHTMLCVCVHDLYRIVMTCTIAWDSPTRTLVV